MADLGDLIRQASSSDAITALGLSPYTPKPMARGGIGGPAPGMTPMGPQVMAPYMAQQIPQARPPQSYREAIQPAINVINNYTQPPQQQATGGKGGGRGYIVGKDVKPETIIQRILQTESSGNYQAKNPHGSASGGFQYTDGTWNNYGGYPTARIAPVEIQNRRMQEDVARRVMQFDGDVFKVIAAHYLPRDASDPATWTRPARVGKHTVDPVANYVRKVIKGTALEDQFDAYLQQHAE